MSWSRIWYRVSVIQSVIENTDLPALAKMHVTNNNNCVGQYERPFNEGRRLREPQCGYDLHFISASPYMHEWWECQSWWVYFLHWLCKNNQLHYGPSIYIIELTICCLSNAIRLCGQAFQVKLSRVITSTNCIMSQWLSRATLAEHQ